MNDGFDKLSAATGLRVGVSSELRRFFEMSQDPTFVAQHNERVARRWDKTKPDHAQLVYSLFDVHVETDAGELIEGFKPFVGEDSVALHHQFYFQLDKEHEYWALRYLGRRVSASFYVRHYIGDGKQWLFLERKTVSLSPSTRGTSANDSSKPSA